MKRGLVLRDPNEISDAEWDERVFALQRAMAAEGVDVALVYGDVFRSDDIGYLTNLCIYWNEGVVAVPAEGSPVFLTKLSPRVHTWMRRTSTVTDLRSGKSFGGLIATMLGEHQTGTVGLVDAGLWPTDIVEEVRTLAPGWEVRSLGSIVRNQRALPSAAEVALLRSGADILSRSMDAASAPGLSVTERIAVLERDIRGGGFTDVFIDTGTTVEGVVSMQATGEYRHGWLRTSRLIATEPAPAWVESVTAALDAAIRSIAPQVTQSELSAAAHEKLRAMPAGATCELRCINQADLATNGELHLSPAAAPHAEGEVVVVSVDVLFPGGRAIVAETILIGPDGAEPLTRSTLAGRESRMTETTA